MDTALRPNGYPYMESEFAPVPGEQIDQREERKSSGKRSKLRGRKSLGLKVGDGSNTRRQGRKSLS